MLIAQEKSESTVEEIKLLMVDHDRVLTNDITQEWPLDVDFDLYRKVEEVGRLRIFTAREEGRMVGYLICILMHSQQRKSLRMAHEEAFYVDPDFRRNGTATKLMEFAEESLKPEADIIMYHAPEANPAFGLLLKKRRCKKYAEYFARRL